MSTKLDDILLATRDLIYEQGLQSVSMSQIAKTAGVGMGTIYNYFKSKEVLVNALYQSIAQKMSDTVLETYDRDASIQERFLQLVHNLLNYGLRHPEDFLLFGMLTHSPYIYDEMKVFDYGIESEFVRLIAQAKQSDVIKDLPDPLLINLTFSAVTGFVRVEVEGKLHLSAILKQQAVAACWDAIKR